MFLLDTSTLLQPCVFPLRPGASCLPNASLVGTRFSQKIIYYHLYGPTSIALSNTSPASLQCRIRDSPLFRHSPIDLSNPEISSAFANKGLSERAFFRALRRFATTSNFHFQHDAATNYSFTISLFQGYFYDLGDAYVLCWSFLLVLRRHGVQTAFTSVLISRKIMPFLRAVSLA